MGDIKFKRENEFIRHHVFPFFDVYRIRGKPVRIWRNNTGGLHRPREGKTDFYTQFNIPGTPDLFGILPWTGRFLAIECKAPAWSDPATGKVYAAGRPTDEQVAWLSNAAAADAVAFWTSDLDTIRDVLTVLESHPYACFSIDGRILPTVLTVKTDRR